MFGFRKSPIDKLPKQNSLGSSNPFDSDTESDNKPTGMIESGVSYNPFDSDTEFDDKPTITSSRTCSEPVLNTADHKTNSFTDDDDLGKGASSLSSSCSQIKENKSFKDKRVLESMSIQEMESHAVNKAEETTNAVINCLKIAEDIRQDGARTVENLHLQGEQIHGTHLMAVDIDRDLSRGERLLSNLGGLFSMPWKPRKARDITGPLTSKAFTDENYGGNRSISAQRERLGLVPALKGWSASRTPCPEPKSALDKIEVEKEKQEDALSDLSNILGELKGMATDMGSELDRQNKNLDYLQDDVDELNSGVRGAIQRARRLIGK